MGCSGSKENVKQAKPGGAKKGGQTTSTKSAQNKKGSAGARPSSPTHKREEDEIKQLEMENEGTAKRSEPSKAPAKAPAQYKPTSGMGYPSLEPPVIENEQAKQGGYIPSSGPGQSKLNEKLKANEEAIKNQKVKKTGYESDEESDYSASDDESASDSGDSEEASEGEEGSGSEYSD